MTREEVREGLAPIIANFISAERDMDYINVRPLSNQILNYLHSQGVVIKVDRELPDILTNNIGCMSKEQIEEFADMVLTECGYPHKMKWTTAGNILIGSIIYIDERNINQYPYLAKYWVLHEIAHIDTWPQDDRHGELFHGRLAELINRFMAGYVAVEPLVEEKVKV